MGWSLAVDPDPYGIWHSTSPWNDRASIMSVPTSLSRMGRRRNRPRKAQEIYAEWQRLINYELPTMFLSYGVTIAAVNERVKASIRNRAPFGPLVGLEKLRTIWIAD